MARVVVVGAGVLGTMHAVVARRAGHEVVHLDRDTEPRSATVRNFGLVWVSGRAPGPELALALRARELWAGMAGLAPSIGFRPDGSMTLATTPEVVAVLEQVVARDDAAERGLHLLDADAVRAVNPALRGSFLAGLHCTTDAVVEPRRALPAIRRWLTENGDYTFLGGREVTALDSGSVTDHLGTRHGADVVVVCPGAETTGATAALVADAPVRPVRLQMCQTEPLDERLATSVADGDSLRYYPAFRVPALADLPPQHEVAARHHAQLLISQRAGGELTIGDTHDYGAPFPFDLDSEPYDLLLGRAEALLGRPLPPVARRWAGVYSQALDEAVCWRDEVAPGVWVVTGPGGRGMTLAPALAEDTFTEIAEIP